MFRNRYTGKKRHDLCWHFWWPYLRGFYLWVLIERMLSHLELQHIIFLSQKSEFTNPSFQCLKPSIFPKLTLNSSHSVQMTTACELAAASYGSLQIVTSRSTINQQIYFLTHMVRNRLLITINPRNDVLSSFMLWLVAITKPQSITPLHQITCRFILPLTEKYL